MFPNPIQLGPLAISYYGIMVAVGVVAALALLSVTAPKRGISVATSRDFCFWMVIVGLIGSRIFYVIFHWPEFADDLPGIFAYWRGGLMFQGGVITAVAVTPFFLKRYGLSLWPTMDVMVPSLALGQCFGRMGCFAAGCCFGRETEADSFFSVIYPIGSLAPDGIPLWPTQLFESFGLLVLTVLLVGAIKSRVFSREGRVGGLYLLGAGLLRLSMEALRGDYRGDPVVWNLPPTTLVACFSIVLGITVLVWKSLEKK